MKELKLNLEQLRSVSSVLDKNEEAAIKGGAAADWLVEFMNTHGSGTYSGSDVNNWLTTFYDPTDPTKPYYGCGTYTSSDWWKGNGNPLTPIELDTVVITNDSSDLEYLTLTYSDNGNEITYLAETVANGIKIVGNGAIWLWNHLNDLWEEE